MVVPMDYSAENDMSKTVTESNVKDEDDSFAIKSQSEGVQSDIKMRELNKKDIAAQKSEV